MIQENKDKIQSEIKHIEYSLAIGNALNKSMDAEFGGKSNMFSDIEEEREELKRLRARL